MSYRVASRIGLAFCCVAMLGCGSSGRGAVSGKVTFNGKPVPAGRIYFNPDFAQGNDGPQGFADIRAGVYDTRQGGKGACGGPTVVVIQGYDGAAGENAGSMGKPLFGEFKTTTDLPKQDCVRDFDVPAAAAEDLPKTPRPGRKI